MTIASALALAAASALGAQPAHIVQDLSAATPIAGNWTYSATRDGSQAVFTSPSGYPQLFVRCTRATRRVSISKPASAAAPSINLWTSSATRSVAASFSPATARLTIDFANYDPLLDAIATSRGRVGFSVGDEPALVLPAQAEVARIVEDCRA